MSKLWTASEESALYIASASCSSKLRTHTGSITENSEVIEMISQKFESRKNRLGISDSTPKRDKLAIITRLAEFKVLKKAFPRIQGRHTFVFNFDKGCQLHEYQPRTTKYSKFLEWLGQPESASYLEEINEIFTSELTSCATIEKANEIIDKRLPSLKINDKKFADCLKDDLIRYFLKIDLGYFKDPKGQKGAKPISLIEVRGEDGCRRYAESKMSQVVDTDPLNKRRGEIAKFYESGAGLPNPSFLSCSVGTGIGKSFGALQAYVNISKKQWDAIANSADVFEPDRMTEAYARLAENGFTNYLFMTPQKAQIDASQKQLDELSARGVQLLSVVSLADLTSPNYVDWLTGVKNYELYEQIFKLYKPSDSKPYSLLKSIKHDEELLAWYKKEGVKEHHDAIEILESKLKSNHRQMVSAMQNLIRVEINKSNMPIKDIVLQGAVAEQKFQLKLSDPNRKKKPSYNKELALFSLVKRMLPFDVCEYLPSVLVMTSKKSLAKQTKLVKGNKDKGYYLKSDLSFDSLIGGKCENSKALVSSVLQSSEEEQIRFIRDSYLAMNDECPYAAKGINFLIVVDELHKSYEDHYQSTFSNLINKDNYLYHVLSSAANMVLLAEEAIDSGFSIDNITEDTEDGDVIKNLLKFRQQLKHYVEERSHFSEWVDGMKFLKTFKISGGCFEVNSSEATEITKITKNIFAFNSKLFTNLEEMKKIRVGHKFGVGAKKLYFDKVDSGDQNPTLYDLYQLSLALMAACSNVKDRQFRSFIKNGGYHTGGNHVVLHDFITKVSSVSQEISSILDQPDMTKGGISVNSLYAYFQPKITFSMQPIEKFDNEDFGTSRDKIRLSFEMDVINSSPEVSYLRMLKGTRNMLLPLSATCGYDRIYDGNYSTRFMKKMAKCLDINYLERDSENLSKVEELVEARAEHRTVNFNVIESDALTFSQSPLSQSMAIAFRSLEQKVMMYENEGQIKRIPELKNPFKKAELMRQLSNMFYCAEHKENAISLSISHKFQSALSKALKKNIEFMRVNYNLKVLFPHPDKYTYDDTIQAFEFEPVLGGQRLRVILYDTSLTTNVEACELSSMDELVTLKDDNTNIILIGSFGSAGTGLNNVVTHELPEEIFPDELFQEDYQNLFICGSPFYSSVKGKEGGFDTLSNFALMIKYWGDQEKNHMQLSDLPLTLNEGESFGVLTKEHQLAIEKLILQCIGRIERRDSKMVSTIHVPKDVLMSSAFVFRDLSKPTRSNKNYRIYRGLSLLGKSYAKFAVQYMDEQSFASPEQREAFEERTRSQGKAIDMAHSFELTRCIQNYQETGCTQSLALNESIRDLSCFTNPKKWMNSVEKAAKNCGAKNVAATANMMLMDMSEMSQVTICDKKSQANDFELSDFIGGVGIYNPWDRIFPTYSSDVSSEGDEYTKEFFFDLEVLKKKAESSGFMPNKSVIPLLRGNIGEMMVKKVFSSLGFEPMKHDEVECKLGTAVYERFDFFYEIDDRLYCVDAKFWSTRRDNPMLSTSTTIAGKERKPKCVIDSVNAISPDRYSKIVFVYANAFYGNTMFTERNRELNHDSTVAYLNIFKKVPRYVRDSKKVTNELTGKETQKYFEEIRNKIEINDRLISLLLGK